MANEQIILDARLLLVEAGFIASPDGRWWMRPRTREVDSNVTLLTTDIIAGGLPYVRKAIAEDAKRPVSSVRIVGPDLKSPVS